MREHFLNNPLPNTYHLGMKTMKQLDTINPPCVREWSKLKEGGRPYPPAHSLDVKTLEKDMTIGDAKRKQFYTKRRRLDISIT